MSTLHDDALAELANRIEAWATEARNASYGQPDATWARLDGMATQAMAAVADIRNLLAAHPAPEAGEVRLVHSTFRAICDCGHRVTWHHDDRGCGYHGFSEQNRCACQLTSDAAVEHILAARLAAVTQPEGTERVEWGWDFGNGTTVVLSDRAMQQPDPIKPNVRRTVTSFPDVVGEWTEVDQ